MRSPEHSENERFLSRAKQRILGAITLYKLSRQFTGASSVIGYNQSAESAVWQQGHEAINLNQPPTMAEAAQLAEELTNADIRAAREEATQEEPTPEQVEYLATRLSLYNDADK